MLDIPLALMGFILAILWLVIAVIREARADHIDLHEGTLPSDANHPERF